MHSAVVFLRISSRSVGRIFIDSSSAVQLGSTYDHRACAPLPPPESKPFRPDHVLRTFLKHCESRAERQDVFVNSGISHGTPTAHHGHTDDPESGDTEMDPTQLRAEALDQATVECGKPRKPPRSQR
eukprot:CAMPEP_0203788406 /NCGR_PEP_ID=MMETSP0100_2-20121128/2832_1 /ASSEMBLY_ACC=CAM_ASM_000210 /TAXON_ID=96639 /ORGANISM=" , Strain NY0313808BC1" /LENGTH=126 /DNA_ID=CAMNT_0050691151 /DNA_START=228 /DNA_END=608 /DNA_ORIENTATION=-